MWKARSASTPSRRRLPAGISLLLLLVLAGLSWYARGREHRPHPGPPSRPQSQAGSQGSPQVGGQAGSRAGTPRPSRFIEGRVVGVSDGDTVKVLDASRQAFTIRLLGIDAPERAQDFGKVAKQVLSDRLFDRQVRIQIKSRDRYGRTLGKVLLEGVDINLEMIREGLVWHYKHYAGDQFPGDADRYAGAQAQARSARKGLWGYENPVEPWNWRHARQGSRE